METLIALLGLVLVQTAAVVSPGPSFVVVMRTALADSSRSALWVALGLGLGTLIWAGAALFGLGLVFAAFPWLYLGLRITGALFLLWMAVQLWRHAGAPIAAAAGDAPSRPAGALPALRTGLLTQLANPKVAVFFGSVFVTFLPPEPSAPFCAAVLTAFFAVDVAWYSLVSLAFTREAVRSRYARAKHVLDRVTGTVLAGLGARLAFAP